MNIDVLELGPMENCTYLVSEGKNALLIDPAYETIKQAQELLTKRGLLTDKPSGMIRLYTTGERADLVAGAEKWLAGQFTSCDHVDL